VSVLVASPATSTGGVRLELTDEERSGVRKLAEEAMTVPPALVDDPQWLAETRRISCRLPVRVIEALRQLRHDAGRSGILCLAGLPVDESDLPDTPSVRDSVERLPALPATVAMLLGQQIGEVFAFRDEKHGALIQNVVPVPSLATSQSNGGSVLLELHNENAFHACRPDLIGLLCLRSDHERRAGTLVSSIRDAMPLLDEADIAVLSSARFTTEAPPSFSAGESTGAGPVLTGHPEDPDIRVDFNATVPQDDEARGALERLGAALMKVSSSLVLQPGEMVFVDNRLVVHGRTDFTPRYDGRDRWLHRLYVHLDSRRGNAHRVGHASVLA
jgi:L-asparagine oxygenase